MTKKATVEADDQEAADVAAVVSDDDRELAEAFKEFADKKDGIEETPEPAEGETSQADDDADTTQGDPQDDTAKNDGEDDKGDADKAPPAKSDAAAPSPKAPAPADGAEPDPWAKAPPELRDLYQRDLAAEKQRYSSDLGRQNAYQRRIRELEAQVLARTDGTAPQRPADKPAPLSVRDFPEVKKMTESYPDLATDIVATIEKAVGQVRDQVLERNDAVRREVSTLSAQAADQQVDKNKSALTARHPDWLALTAKPEFAEFYETRTDAFKQRMLANADNIVDLDAADEAITFYKGWLALRSPAPQAPVQEQPSQPNVAETPNQLAERRQRQKQSSKTMPDRTPGGPSAPPADDINALFNHFASQKDRRKA